MPMKFLDQAKIFIQSGDGGKGKVSFRRDKYVEFGGPDGGDGGKGGGIYVRSSASLNTLIDYRYRQHFRAQNGRNGAGRQMHGSNGEDVVLKVPVGTQVLSDDKGVVMADLMAAGQCVKLLSGGDGGKGNTHFKTSTNRAPRQFGSGWEGQKQWLWLQLKSIADVGLIGMPNAGKSTFLSKISHAKPEIANYPFTTRAPVLGTVKAKPNLVVADIPGLLRGASKGVGLGYRFLGHVERCKVLLHILDTSQAAVLEMYITVRRELEKYGRGLTEKPEIIALNKMDLVDTKTIVAIDRGLRKLTDHAIVIMSGATGKNIPTVIDTVCKKMQHIEQKYNEKVSTTRAWQP